MRRNQSKPWNKSKDSLATYESTIDHLDQELCTPCGVKCKIPKNDCSKWLTCVKNYYKDQEIVPVEKANSNTTLKIEVGVQIVTMNIYKSTGIINIQAEGDMCFEIHKDICNIVDILKSNVNTPETTITASTSKSIDHSDIIVKSVEAVESSNNTSEYSVVSPSSVEIHTGAETVVETPKNSKTEKDLQRIVNSKIEQLRNTPLRSTSQGIFVQKLAKVDSLEESFVKYQKDNNSVLQDIVNKLDTIDKALNKKVNVTSKCDRSSVPSYAENAGTKIQDSLQDITSALGAIEEKLYSKIEESFGKKLNSRMDSLNSSILKQQKDSDTRFDQIKGSVKTIEDYVYEKNKALFDELINGLEISPHDAHFDITSTGEKSIEGSIFQAHAAKVNSKEEAMQFISHIITGQYMRKSEHFYSAYKTQNTSIDTHEDPGSRSIRDILNQSKQTNIAIVVTRHFGGKHIHNKRWETIRDVSTEVLNNFIDITNQVHDESGINDTIDTCEEVISQDHVSVKNDKEQGNIQDKTPDNVNCSSINTNSMSASVLDINDKRISENTNSLREPQYDQYNDPSYSPIKPDVVLLIDSVGKNISPKLLFGRNQCFIRKMSTLSQLECNLNGWQTNTAVSKAIVHVGINDVRNGKPVPEIVRNIENSIKVLQQKLPNAKVAYSSLLLSDSSPVSLKTKVSEINTSIQGFCKSNGILFINHGKFKDQLFDNQFHINDSGTRLFVKHITDCYRGLHIVHGPSRYSDIKQNKFAHFVDTGTGYKPPIHKPWQSNSSNEGFKRFGNFVDTSHTTYKPPMRKPWHFGNNVHKPTISKPWQSNSTNEGPISSQLLDISHHIDENRYGKNQNIPPFRGNPSSNMDMDDMLKLARLMAKLDYI